MTIEETVGLEILYSVRRKRNLVKLAEGKVFEHMIKSVILLFFLTQRKSHVYEYFTYPLF